MKSKEIDTKKKRKSTKKVSTVKKKTEEIDFTRKERMPIYISYPVRISFFSVLLIISLVVSFYCAKESFEFTQSKTINYSNNHSTKYKVYLKENNFYETDYLEENKVYIASLIDYVDIDFRYAFEIDEEVPVDFKYDIIGKLKIEDEKGEVFLEKEYNLLDEKNKTLNNDTAVAIEENIKVDYGYYNQLANSFKSTYGLDTVSNLEVILRIKKDSEEINFSNDDEMVLKIPLSEKTINISFTSNDSQDSNYVALKPELKFNKEIFGIELVFVFLSCFLIYKISDLLVLLYVPKSKYDKYISKLLRSYDRLIVVTNTKINFDDKNIIEVNNFDELLDVRDNLKLPILYHDIVRHQKCIFYIKDYNDIYLVTIKAVDMEDTKPVEQKNS